MIHPNKDRTYSHPDKTGRIVQAGDSATIHPNFIGLRGECEVLEDEGGLFFRDPKTKRELYVDLVLSHLFTITDTVVVEEDDMGYMEAFLSGITA